MNFTLILTLSILFSLVSQSKGKTTNQFWPFGSTCPFDSPALRRVKPDLGLHGDWQKTTKNIDSVQGTPEVIIALCANRLTDRTALSCSFIKEAAS